MHEVIMCRRPQHTVLLKNIGPPFNFETYLEQPPFVEGSKPSYLSIFPNPKIPIPVHNCRASDGAMTIAVQHAVKLIGRVRYKTFVIFHFEVGILSRAEGQFRHSLEAGLNVSVVYRI